MHPKITELELSSTFAYNIKNKFLAKNEFKSSPEEIVKKLFEPQEILRIIHHILEKISLTNDEANGQVQNMLEYYHTQNVIIDVVPLHDWRNNISENEMNENNTIKKYLGEHSSLYFFFLTYLQKWTIYPAIIGVLVFLMNNIFNLSVETSPFDSLFSLFMIVWGALFVAFWEKKEENIAYEWHCFGKSLQARGTIHYSEQHFEERINDVTGMVERYYPTKKRLIRYLISALRLFPYLLLTFFVLICSLNIRGFVYPEHKFIYISSLSSLAEKNGIFDKNTGRTIIPTLLHVIIIALINSFYKEICLETTKSEYHKTLSEFENSLIIKRFIFETFNAFTDFTYISFIILDIEGLRKALTSLFIIDEFRRLITETFIPFIKLKLSGKKKMVSADKKLEENIGIEQYIDEKLEEISLAVYQPFDDYLEIVFNFGYITLFASAFPLAPLIIYVFHLLEEKSDKFKIFHLHRRSLPERANSIGSWKAVLQVISLLSVITNIVLLSFSSHKILEFLNLINEKIDESSVFYTIGDKKNETEISWDTFGKYIILIVFALEHFLFILIWIFKAFVNRMEDWTTLYKKRKIQKQKLKKNKMKDGISEASKIIDRD